MNFMHMGPKVRVAREVCGLTQTALGKKLGYGSSQFVSNIERGLALYPVKTFKQIANILNIPVPSLLAYYLKDVEYQARKELGMGIKRG